MNRATRRALARKTMNLHQTSTPVATPEPQPVPPSDRFPEPGFPFPSLDSLTNPPNPPESPLSEAQLNANRANAKKSCGPKTPEGRAVSSQNRTTHGLTRNGALVILPSEDLADYQAFRQGLLDKHQPADEHEDFLVNEIAEAYWLARRARNFLTTCLDPLTGEIANLQKFNAYLRYQTTHTREAGKALSELLKLRAETRKVEIGFVSQKRLEEDQHIKTARQEQKNQKHYWEVLRKDGEACHQIAINSLFNTKAAAENPGFEAQYDAELKKRGFHQTQMDVAAA
jgi:hypothetical protein